MKKQIITFVITALFWLFSLNGFTQPPSPPSGAGHGAAGNQNGGSAPVGGGLFILLGLGALYGSNKLYRLFEKDKEELES